jgi:hypothetical protein
VRSALHERDQRARLDCKRNAVRRRFLFGDAAAAHSASIRSMDAGDNGGMPYFSK